MQDGLPQPSSALSPWSTSTAPAYCRDLSGRLLAANTAFTRKFGRGISVQDHDSVVALINPDDMAEYKSAESELQKPPHQVTRSHRWLTPQGWRWMSWEETVLIDESGVPVAVRAVGHDITRQRLAEELYVKLSRAIEQCPIGIVITDAEGRTQYVNPKFTEASGHTLEECLEKDTRVLRDGHPDDESYQRFIETVTAGSEWQGELARTGPDGKRIWESVQASCIRNASGEITNLLCLREDITERKRLEEELRQSQKMESLGEIAGGIAHDFNNLLAVINGYAELTTLHPNDPSLLQKSLREIKRASQRATGLVRQILTFSRKAQVHFAPVDLNQLIRDLSALLAETFPRKVSFNFALVDGLPTLMADQNQLQQVVLNLFVNARDAMPDGGTISVTTSLISGDAVKHSEADRSKSYVCLQVSDTGVGMPPEVKARIFEPFFTTKLGSGGTGLGLAVVYGIITSHHGFIDVESSPGAGSTFKIVMPASGAGAVAAAQAELNTFPDGDESLLIVDDEDALRNILRTAFTRKGYSVVSASNGLEAIEILGDPSHSIDAVLLDINMPGASGVDVIKTIKSHRPDLPVLILSGHINAETRNTLEHLGQTDLISKPYRLDELGRRLRNMLGEKPVAKVGA
jgi:two-component system cell cycle sensor histidine kinase/response regulator CckA